MNQKFVELRNMAAYGSITGVTRGIVRRLVLKANQRIVRSKRRSGSALMQEDWDNCLILDACRVDMFERNDDFLEEYTDSVRSLGSSSEEFIEENFLGQEYHDTVYVTSNPHAKDIESSVFHDIIHVYEDGWDSELATIPPQTMVDAAKRAHDDYPHKRLIIHFMQPHYPFIGQFGQQITEKGIFQGAVNTDASGVERYSIWTQLNFGISPTTANEIWKAYEENLTIVSKPALNLANELTGKSVITSDHGNLLGERVWPIPVRGYGHPNYTKAPSLTNVPWYTPTYGCRKEVKSDPPVASKEISNDIVSDRLEDLGYVS